MVIDLHAKSQVNICKRLGKKFGKLILWTDRRTECKPKVPFGFPGRGLITKINDSKIEVAESWFLCTALLHNLFYQYMKFQVDSFYSLEVVAWTKSGFSRQTDIQDDSSINSSPKLRLVARGIITKKVRKMN